jgi:hypothetical protein
VNPASRFRAWRRRRRLQSAARRSHSPLREFIYLDDVSVYSLIASRVGPVATEFTDSESASLQSDVTASAGVGIAGLGKADIASRLQAAQTQGSQVLRKAIVQTTFKDLYELEKSSLVMRAAETTEDPPKVRAFGDLLSPRDELRPWVVSAEALHRGALLEIEVELSAEPIFRMSTVTSALVEMMRESEELARAAASTGELDQVAAISRVIERLLAGLIPVRGRAIDFEVIAANGREWVIHSQVARELTDDSVEVRRFPLYVVGVAQEALFWKDIRRVLFSRSRYRALCRVSRPGVQTSWTPVKLVEVLEDVAPGLAASLGSATDNVLSAVADAHDASSLESTEQSRMGDALLDYGTLVAAHYGCALAKEEMLEAGLPTAAQRSLHATLESRRSAFAEVTSFVANRFGIEIEPEVAALCRSVAWMDRLMISSAPIEGMSGSLLSAPTPASPTERYLDVEFVAMYW